MKSTLLKAIYDGWRRLRLFCILTIMICQISCISQPLMKPSEQLFTPLAEKRLSDFEQTLAHLTLFGVTGDAMHLGVQWLYASLCIPYNLTPTYESPLWKALSIGLSLEVAVSASQVLSPLHQVSKDNLKAQNLSQANWAFWPQNKGDQEGWSDERPAWLDLYSQCPKVFTPKSKVINRSLWPISLLSSDQWIGSIKSLDLYRFIKLNRAEALLDQWMIGAESVTQQSEDGGQNTDQIQVFKEWRWWLDYVQGVILGEYSGVEFGWPAQLTRMTWSQSLVYTESCSIWRRLYQDSLALLMKSAPHRRPILQKASAQVALLNGLCQLSIGEHQVALETWDYAVLSSQDDVAPVTLALSRYHQLRLLIELGRYHEAIKLRDVMPSPNSPLFNPYAFALGEAMSYAGQDDGLMGLCTEIFRDQSWRKDPFLRGLFYLFIRGLTRFNFEARVLELLEDLGPRNELYERVFIFAHIALDEGREPIGRAATRWLLGHHESARWRPRYHALEARASILRLDQSGFKRALNMISPSSGAIVSAINKGRRGAFFEEQDRALAELLRVEVPKIAGWSNRRSIDQKRRLEWLDLIAGEMQVFLRLRPETKVHQELISLYRSIKQNLPVAQLRAYSEKIGRKQSVSVLIGYVRVNGVDLSHLEPREVSLQLSRPPSLTLIPQPSLDPSKWRLMWTQEDHGVSGNNQGGIQ
jgi:hypothetical protein